MIKQPAYLKKGDKIAIVCPARKLKKPITDAIAVLEGWGLQVVTGKSVSAEHYLFAGDDNLRTEDLQSFLDDPDIKAIIAGRGGYGTIRIIDQLDFTLFKESPKWIVGFSDITVLISHLTSVIGTQSIHGQMPGAFDDATQESLESLRKALFGEHLRYTCESTYPNIQGEAEGILIGGNLSMLIAIEGSVSAMDYKDKILFLEDVGEYEYSIDRMVRMLYRSGKFSQLKGLIVGSFNGLKLEDVPFGQNPQQIIADVVAEYGYPVCFDFPVGHINDNRALIVGKDARLKIGEHTTLFDQ